MTAYKIGQIFEGTYSIDAANWCNNQGDCYIEEIDSITNESGETVRRFQIVTVPEITTEELAKQVRAERDRRIKEVRWIIERHRDELILGKTTTLTNEQYESYLLYIQALRDLPQQLNFPWNGVNDPDCPWPEKPNSI